MEGHAPVEGVPPRPETARLAVADERFGKRHSCNGILKIGHLLEVLAYPEKLLCEGALVAAARQRVPGGQVDERTALRVAPLAAALQKGVGIDHLGHGNDRLQLAHPPVGDLFHIVDEALLGIVEPGQPGVDLGDGGVRAFAVARQAPSRSCTPRRVTSPAVRNGARASTGERV